jgi:hypothetical protein
MAEFELKYERERVNVEKLHDELRGLLGESLVGVSAGPGVVRVHTAQDASKQSALIGEAVAAHRAEDLTAAQKAEQDRRELIRTLKAVPVAKWNEEQRLAALRVLWEMVTNQTGA